MSAHESERLSAYLDGELSAVDREAVERHLAGCEACATRLAELGAVDRAARTLPVEAPPGYFESLPGRVRARIQARPPRRHLPAWTWAAAAVLLLAIVTPYTLRQVRAPGAEPAPPAALAPAPLEKRPVEHKEEAAAGRVETTPPPALARADEAKRQGASGGAPVQTRPPAAPLAAAAPPTPASAKEGFAQGPPPAAAAALGLQSAERPRTETRAGRNDAAGTMVGQAERDRAREEAEEAGAPQPPAAARLAPMKASRAGVEAPVAADEAPAASTPDERAFRELDARRPRNGQEWRRLREDWRAFVAAFPHSSFVDEARVRTIEAGYEARATNTDPEDDPVFRRDLQAYLERTDARQKARVLRLEPGP